MPRLLNSDKLQQGDAFAKAWAVGCVPASGATSPVTARWLRASHSSDPYTAASPTQQ
jgi:hypothetical protein